MRSANFIFIPRKERRIPWLLALYIYVCLANIARADGKTRLQLLSVVRLLLRASVSRTPTALAVRDFGRSIGGFHGALLYVKMTRALLALQTARYQNDIITGADVEVLHIPIIALRQ